MNKVHILDCTLRDGGYCNQWLFGHDNIKEIINNLNEANVDVIECGFITQKNIFGKDYSKFNTINEFKDVLGQKQKGKLYVAMMNYGEFSVDDLPANDGSSIDGIRLAFHKKNRFEALDLCKKIKEKGYLVFVQPMVSINYSDSEFIEMIKKVNDIGPYAFYIVDSFGMMKSKDLNRFFYLIENNLEESIKIGFHSHNNLQLAYSNALTLLSLPTNKDIILDSSIYGMGRGAGNLNTELLVGYLNENFEKQYRIKPLLHVVDTILGKFYHENHWGYSLPNYLSAKHNAHPNYAGFLDEKNTLTFEEIDEIFSMMPQEKKVEFDKNYIECLYVQYMEKGSIQNSREEELKGILRKKTVLLIAPGKSSTTEKDIIENVSNKNDVISISVNFDYQFIKTNFIFLSNIRRFKDLGNKSKEKCIVTSNVPFDNVYYQADYKSLLNEEDFVNDNAGLMAIKLLIRFGSSKVLLAGFDGYSHESKENYADSNMAWITRNTVLDQMNSGMCKVLKQLNNDIDIEFLTKPVHLKIGD